MKLEETTVVIEPRSTAACLDLAVLFYRRHARALVPVVVASVATGGLVSYYATARSESGFFWSALFFFLLSPVLGGVVVGAAGPAVFGAPFDAAALFRAGSPKWAFLFSTALWRILILVSGFLCFGLPCLPIAVFCGFLPEVMLLERVPSARSRARLSELVGGSFFDLLGRAVLILSCTAGAAATLFLLVDQALFVLFTWPILAGRLDWSDPFADLGTLLTGDPLVVSVLAATAWAVYPVARLAWFFCYLDVRIRREGWDLELDFRIEARRLEAIA